MMTGCTIRIITNADHLLDLAATEMADVPGILERWLHEFWKILEKYGIWFTLASCSS